MEVWAHHLPSHGNLWYLLPGRAILDRGVGGLFRATLKSIDGDGVSMRRLVERGRIYLGIRPNFAVFIVGHRRLAATQRVLLLLLLLGLLPLVYLDLALHPGVGGRQNALQLVL